MAVSRTFVTAIAAFVAGAALTARPGKAEQSEEPPAGDGGSGEIEVGAVDGELRLWRARESVRHAELRIGAQASNLAAMESRATSTLGWTVAGGLAVGAAALFEGAYSVPASAATICLMLASTASLIAIWPGTWGVVGCEPHVVREEALGSELEVEEVVVGKYEATITVNERRLTRFGRLLSISWIVAIAALPVAVVAAHYARAISSAPLVSAFGKWLLPAWKACSYSL